MTSEDDNDIVDVFVKSLVADFKYLADNNSSKKIMVIYYHAIVRTIEESVKCKRIDLYKKIIRSFSSCFHYTNRNDFPLNYFIQIFEKVYENITTIGNGEYSNFLENELFELYITIVHEAENSEIEQRVLLSNGRMLYLAYTNYYDEDIFKDIFERFVSSIVYTLTYLSKKESEILTGILTTLYKEIEEKQNKNIFCLYLTNINRIIDNSFRSKNEYCIKYLGHLLDISMTSRLYDNDEKFEKKRFENLKKCIRLFPENSMIFLPDYKTKIEHRKRNYKEIKYISDNFSDVFRTLFNCDRYDIMSFYLDYLNECIFIFSQDERECQEYFIGLYEELLVRGIRSETTDLFNVIMFNFSDLLSDLDKEKKISAALLERIFSLFDKVGSNLLDTTEYALQSYFLDYFRTLAEKINSIKTKEQKQRITEILFHFTIEMLESKNEKSLKICSNNMGWYAVFLENAGDFESYKITIDVAANMYNLAVEQDYEKSTIAFLGTLFIVLGAYAVSHKALAYSDYIVRKVHSLKDKETLKISKDLRYFEYKYWDSVFKGDAKSAISKFYKQLNSSNSN